MKQFVTLLIIIICSSITSHAQTYLDHLKQKNQGQGVVTVNQSKAIDELVNGKPVAPQDDKTKTTPQPQKKQTPDSLKKNEPRHEIGKEPTTPGTQHGNATQHKDSNATQHKDSNATQHKEGNRENAQKAEGNATKAENKKEETEMPVVDMRKKVMRKSYKVTGYRVQAFAGGNSRNDRLKAEQTGNTLKMNFPDQPVYVHFYSPRWICRMGNFRSMAEAQKVLQKVRALGYKQACLVKGQITVQY